MSTRRALRSALSVTLGLPPSTVYEAVRHVVDLCPDDAPGPQGALIPSAPTVKWFLLACCAALPVAGTPVNRWPEGGRAVGLRQRAMNWNELTAIPGASHTTGDPPLILRALTAANMPLGYTLDILFQELLKPEFLAHFIAPGTPFLDSAILLGLHGRLNSYASLKFNLRDGSTLKAKFRHPAFDASIPPPALVVRLGLGMRALAALSGVCHGVTNVEDVARAAAIPVHEPVMEPETTRPRRRAVFVPGQPTNRRPAAPRIEPPPAPAPQLGPPAPSDLMRAANFFGTRPPRKS